MSEDLQSIPFPEGVGEALQVHDRMLRESIDRLGLADMAVATAESARAEVRQEVLRRQQEIQQACLRAMQASGVTNVQGWYADLEKRIFLRAK